MDSGVAFVCTPKAPRRWEHPVALSRSESALCTQTSIHTGHTALSPPSSLHPQSQLGAESLQSFLERGGAGHKIDPRFPSSETKKAEVVFPNSNVTSLCHLTNQFTCLPNAGS